MGVGVVNVRWREAEVKGHALSVYSALSALQETDQHTLIYTAQKIKGTLQKHIRS